MSDKKENEEGSKENDGEETKWMWKYTLKVESNCEIE